jgi:hypothetical protein
MLNLDPQYLEPSKPHDLNLDWYTIECFNYNVVPCQMHLQFHFLILQTIKKKNLITAWTLFIPCGLNLSKLFFTSLDHKYLVMVTIIWPTSILVFMCLWLIYNAHQQILQFCWTRYAITEYLSRSTSIKLVSMSFWVEVNLCRYLICLYCILDFIINRGEF